MAKKRPGPFALPPDRYPIGDVKHAGFAITRLYMGSVTAADRKKVIAAIRKRYPKNKNLKERIQRLLEKKAGKKVAKKKTKKRKTTKKGNRRKGKPAGSRLAYDDLPKKKRKKRKKVKKKTDPKRRKKRTKKGILELLTNYLVN
jgi:hypothetical protein